MPLDDTPTRPASLLIAILLLVGLAPTATPQGGPAGGGAAAAFSLRIGERFVYRGERPPNPLDDAPRDTSSRVMPKPRELTVRVTGEAKCDAGVCVVLESNQVIDVPREGRAAAATTDSKALVDPATGAIVEIQGVILLGGRETPHRKRVTSRNAVFEDVYGPWMLDLGDAWEASFDLSGGRQRTYTVSGRETVDGRECFVVQRVTPMPNGTTQTTVYWVDVERRISIRVRQGDWILSLVETIAGE
jgi:hypothetical protein